MTLNIELTKLIFARTCLAIQKWGCVPLPAIQLLTLFLRSGYMHYARNHILTVCMYGTAGKGGMNLVSRGRQNAETTEPANSKSFLPKKNWQKILVKVIPFMLTLFQRTVYLSPYYYWRCESRYLSRGMFPHSLFFSLFFPYGDAVYRWIPTFRGN